jgi:gliding motility-associated-like protein
VKPTNLTAAITFAIFSLNFEIAPLRETPRTASCNCSVYIPDVFSPNKDGKNDTFHPFASTSCVITDYHLRVYDRWGSLVFEGTSLDQEWDGTVKGELPQSANFLYVLTYTVDEAGKMKNKIESGNLTLLL